MTEPRKTPRSDSSMLQAELGCVTINFVSIDFARALEAETQELAEALDDMLFYMPDDEMRENARAALTRHRAKQEVGT